MAVIHAQHLRRVFTTEGGTQTVAIEDVSLNVEKGEFVGIMGQSGSGKSTLLHILGLLDRPTGGTYYLQETDTTHLSDDELAHLRNEEIGFVFQAFHLLARTTVLDNVMLPLVYASGPPSEHRQLALQAIEEVGLSHRIQHLPSQLSGGEKQRVAIARALVNKPNIIFADEPTGNLDTKTGEMIMELIDKLHGEGRTIIVITHESSTASFAQRVIELQDGLIIREEAVHTAHGEYHK